MYYNPALFTVYNDESDKLQRIFRTIALVTIFDMSGWTLTQVCIASLSFFNMSSESKTIVRSRETHYIEDDKRFCFATLAGVPVNLGIAVKSFIYYHTRWADPCPLSYFLFSSDYRNAINCQFRSIRGIRPTVIPLQSIENGEEM